MKLMKNLFALGLLCACTLASAQWQWLDKEGRKVFSDRAPPPEVLEKNIIKRPGVRNTVALAPTENGDGAVLRGQNSATASSALPAIGARELGVDKDLEAKKKQVADADAAKKRAEEEKFVKAKIENCVRLKQAKVTLDSGARIGRVNAAGEHEVMDEAARVNEGKRIQAVMATDCS